MPSRADLPALDESSLPPLKGVVSMLQGCAMQVLYPQVNEITQRMLRRLGYAVWQKDLGCCGALQAHNGYLGDAREMRDRLFAKLPEDMPLIVNSAGCGAWLKDSGREHVFDVSEFLLAEGLADVIVRQGMRGPITATYHDACHLTHGQGIRSAPRELLRAVPGLRMVEMIEADTCCGSAGIYNILQPEMARQLLDRKWVNVAATGASIVATGNPGCHSWIAQAAREHGSTVEVLHTLEVLERAFTSDRG